MVLLIQIPIGVHRTAVLQSATWKFVDCAQCRERYAYPLHLEARGEDHDLLFMDAEGSAKRAVAQAQEKLEKQSQNLVLAIPCPNCGTYQPDMAQLLKEKATINAQQIVGGVLTLLALVPLALDAVKLWAFTVILAVPGLILVGIGLRRAFRFDANAGDPEPRKALGRKCAVWGEELVAVQADPSTAEAAASQPTTRDK